MSDTVSDSRKTHRLTRIAPADWTIMALTGLLLYLCVLLGLLPEIEP